MPPDAPPPLKRCRRCDAPIPVPRCWAITSKAYQAKKDCGQQCWVLARREHRTGAAIAKIEIPIPIVFERGVSPDTPSCPKCHASRAALSCAAGILSCLMCGGTWPIKGVPLEAAFAAERMG